MDVEQLAVIPLTGRFTYRHSTSPLNVTAIMMVLQIKVASNVSVSIIIIYITQGVIDPTYFNDSGTPYLIWKVDGNAHGNPTPILAAQLAHTGTTIIGKPTELIRNDETWEGGLVEGPWIVKNGVEYFLFYSAGGGFKSTNYSVWVAKASKLLGPYQKNPHAILHTKLPEDGHSWKGPGHCSVLPLFGSTDRGYVIFYHAWVHGKILPFRVMLMDALTWQDGWPRVVGGVPSETREPVLA